MRPDNLKPYGQAGFKDSGVIKFHEVIKHWNEEPVEGFGIIGLPLSKPSISHSGAAFAPDTIRKALYNTATYAFEEDIEFAEADITDFGDIRMHVTDLKASQDRIQDTLEIILQENKSMNPVILGGDHSVSAPSIKAFSKVKGRVGVIQFDAHHDLRNLEDGGPSNGTPFRNLIESGALLPEDLVQIGIRNFANGKDYYTYAMQHGVTVHSMKAVREKGMLSLVKDAYESLKDKVDTIYLSVDIDVLDQAHAPGCPAIGPGGMNTEDLMEGVKSLAKQEKVSAVDIVEIDPKQDFRDMTSRVGAHIALSFLIGKTLGER